MKGSGATSQWALDLSLRPWGGYSCTDESADDACGGEVSAFRLAEDLSDWERLDTPKESLGPEPELTVTTGPQNVGVFDIGQLSLAIDADGTVTTLTSPFPTPNGGTSGVVNDTRIVAAYGPADELTLPVPIVEAVGVQSLCCRTATGTDRAGAGGHPELDRAPHLRPRLHVDPSPRQEPPEWVIDPSSGTLSPIESNTLEMVPDPGYMDPGEQAIVPGTTPGVRHQQRRANGATNWSRPLGYTACSRRLGHATDSRLGSRHRHRRLHPGLVGPRAWPNLGRRRVSQNAVLSAGPIDLCCGTLGAERPSGT